VANPSPAKVSVECPRCGFKQMEYAAAKSTVCRQCGVREQKTAPEGPSFLRKFESKWHQHQWHQHHHSIVQCFECNRKREVSDVAPSTVCPACSAPIDLLNYEISGYFNRMIRTRGDVHLTAKGDLSSNSVVCNSALIEGKFRGNLHCSKAATINFVGKLPGHFSARHVIIERKADIQCFRRVRVASIEIKGKMSGNIIAQTVVTIHKTGSLEGNVTAKGITVEKGGIFSGQLVIG
jgi:cytoskeletal protein CcmA (bactofilin family)